MAVQEDKHSNLQLLYTLFCDDVRLEAGNKLSFMGVFQNIMVQQLPVSLIKFAVVNHWRGEGVHLSEVRIRGIAARNPDDLRGWPQALEEFEEVTILGHDYRTDLPRRLKDLSVLGPGQTEVTYRACLNPKVCADPRR